MLWHDDVRLWEENDATCRLCGEATLVVVNIDMKAVRVCNSCCLSVTKQTVQALTIESVGGKDA